MNDKERILMAIVRMAYSLNLSRKIQDLPSPSSAFPQLDFDPSNIKPGDLVMAITSQPNDYLIAFFVEWGSSPGEAIVRGIGTNDLCSYSNESFVAIRGLHDFQAYDGTRLKTYNKIQKAIHRTSYWLKPNTISFHKNEVTVSCREYMKSDEVLKITFPHNSNTTIKSIIALLRPAAEKAGIKCELYKK